MSRVTYDYYLSQPIVVRRRVPFTLRPTFRRVGLPMGYYRVTRFGVTERIEWRSRRWVLAE